MSTRISHTSWHYMSKQVQQRSKTRALLSRVEAKAVFLSDLVHPAASFNFHARSQTFGGNTHDDIF